ncbi:hypothetical protein Y1Q_0015238 [Alligator mississippiensis]|uniref:Uncharacterized protein n=1 Tax=Alligator mississippiensis TaxID=8496 RepID=A0A151NL22_ALLMI|nr:hypothetical protein Y1Q_0015238 [Alligator mississippiensis]
MVMAEVDTHRIGNHTVMREFILLGFPNLCTFLPRWTKLLLVCCTSSFLPKKTVYIWAMITKRTIRTMNVVFLYWKHTLN